MADAAGKSSTKKKSTTTRRRRKTTTAAKSPAERSGSSGDSTATSSSAAGAGLGLDPDTTWRGDGPERARDPQPAQPPDEADYVAPPVELVEWTPERAGMIVRSGGYLLHSFDPVSREVGGDDLWTSTEADVDAIAPPLARILNRYEPARALAGMSDEAELAFGVIGYVRSNLAQRGRVLSNIQEREPGVEWGPEAEAILEDEPPGDDTGTLGGTFGAPPDE